MNAAVVARTGARLAIRAMWSGGRPRRGLLPLALALLLFVTVGWAARALFEALARAHAPLGGARPALGWAFTLAGILVALGDLHVAVAALVAGSDLERLRAAPLAPRQVLVLKLFETLPRTLAPVLGIALPASLAYASVAGGVPPLVLGSSLLALWAVPLGLGVALALPLLRLAPAARVRESLAVLATFAFVGGWLVNAFWVPRLAADAAGPAAGLGALPALPAWSPATWAADALAGPAAGVPARVAGCLAASALALALAGASAARLLTGLHAHAAAHAGRTVRARARRAPTLALAFLERDAALVARDWPVVLDALASLALWCLLPLAVLPVAPLPRLELARDMLIAVSVSLGHDVAARALPLERMALAWARLSPVGGARWLRLRVLGVALVNGALVSAATALVCVALGLRGRAVPDAYAFALAGATAATATGMLVGALLGDPAWTDPRAMLGAGGRAASAGALLAEAGVWLALSHRLAAEPIPVWGWLALPGGAALFAALLLAVAARVLERREWSRS